MLRIVYAEGRIGRYHGAHRLYPDQAEAGRFPTLRGSPGLEDYRQHDAATYRMAFPTIETYFGPTLVEMGCGYSYVNYIGQPYLSVARSLKSQHMIVRTIPEGEELPPQLLAENIVIVYNESTKRATNIIYSSPPGPRAAPTPMPGGENGT